MTRRAESSSQVGKSPAQEDLPKIEVFVPSLVLCESNYRQLRSYVSQNTDNRHHKIEVFVHFYGL